MAPQTFQVVRGYKCETFQVDQVKKVTKWRCKICQEQQSLLQVFSSGSGAACRKVVQELNWKRMELSTAQGEENLVNERTVLIEVNDEDDGTDMMLRTLDTNVTESNKKSKWLTYLPPKESFIYNDDEEDNFPDIELVKVGLEVRNKSSSNESSSRENVELEKSTLERKSEDNNVFMPPIRSKWNKFSSD